MFAPGARRVSVWEIMKSMAEIMSPVNNGNRCAEVAAGVKEKIKITMIFVCVWNVSSYVLKIEPFQHPLLYLSHKKGGLGIKEKKKNVRTPITWDHPLVNCTAGSSLPGLLLAEIMFVSLLNAAVRRLV